MDHPANITSPFTPCYRLFTVKMRLLYLTGSTVDMLANMSRSHSQEARQPIVRAPNHAKLDISQQATYSMYLPQFFRALHNEIQICSDYSLSAKANQVRFLAGSLADFRAWESCRTVPLAAGFSRGSPVPCTLELLHYSHRFLRIGPRYLDSTTATGACKFEHFLNNELPHRWISSQGPADLALHHWPPSRPISLSVIFPCEGFEKDSMPPLSKTADELSDIKQEAIGGCLWARESNECLRSRRRRDLELITSPEAARRAKSAVRESWKRIRLGRTYRRGRGETNTCKHHLLETTKTRQKRPRLTCGNGLAGTPLCRAGARASSIKRSVLGQQAAGCGPLAPISILPGCKLWTREARISLFLLFPSKMVDFAYKNKIFSIFP
ncbi:hypothetical protein PR048_000806 [Dryococelus australis]|uniref:Uncharacterized protein n=1 Tax=Dryococelus australis TaxID=614101 RepID=A0ABQ9IFM6_9NEOP|nr:hypothetical protein PR048_000806 [Dryococelus australis]